MQGAHRGTLLRLALTEKLALTTLYCSPHGLMASNDLFNSHKAGKGGSLHLIQPHFYVFDSILQVGDQDIFQRVDAAAGYLDLVGK